MPPVLLRDESIRILPRIPNAKHNDHIVVVGQPVDDKVRTHDEVPIATDRQQVLMNRPHFGVIT